MVARWRGCERVPPPCQHREQDAGDHQGPPFPTPPPSPLQNLMGFSSVDAYWATIKALPTMLPHPRPYGKGISIARMQSQEAITLDFCHKISYKYD